MSKKLLFLPTIVLLSLGGSLLIADRASTTTSTPVPRTVPPPVASAPPLPAPPFTPEIQPRRDQGLIQRLTPRVEIWRANSNHPQIPARRSAKGNSDESFVTGTDPVTIRLVFDRRSAGEQVTVISGRGLVLNPPQQVLTISAQGDCAFLAQVDPREPRGHMLIYCRNVRTVVPLTRAPLRVVEASEARGGRP